MSAQILAESFRLSNEMSYRTLSPLCDASIRECYRRIFQLKFLAPTSEFSFEVEQIEELLDYAIENGDIVTIPSDVCKSNERGFWMLKGFWDNFSTHRIEKHNLCFKNDKDTYLIHCDLKSFVKLISIYTHALIPFC